MSNLNVDPEALKASQPAIARAAERITTAVQQAQQAIQAEGECWGSDEIGEKFAKDYKPGADDGLAGISSLSMVVEALGHGVTNIAAAFQNQDQSTAGKLDGMS